MKNVTFNRHCFACSLAVCLLISVCVAQPPRAAVNDDNLSIAGASLTEWRERMSTLDLQSPTSSRWVPGLIELMESRDVPWFTRRQAALTLGRLGSHATDAVPHVIQLLDESDDDHTIAPQLWAIKSLGLYGPLAESATPELIRIYRTAATSHLARLSILDTLSQIGPNHPAAIPQLLTVAGETAASSHEQVELRQAAIEAIGMVGPAASIAVPVLARALDDRDPITRRLAAETLKRIGPASEIVAQPLLEHMVTDDAVEVQDAAANAIQAIGPSLGPVLSEWLLSDDAVVRAHVARILGQWGTQARPWASNLRELWNDSDPHVQIAALEASLKVDGPSSALTHGAVRHFADDDRQLRRRAYLLFEKCADYHVDVRSDLEALRMHPESYARDLAERALRE